MFVMDILQPCTAVQCVVVSHRTQLQSKSCSYSYVFTLLKWHGGYMNRLAGQRAQLIPLALTLLKCWQLRGGTPYGESTLLPSWLTASLPLRWVTACLRLFSQPHRVNSRICMGALRRHLLLTCKHARHCHSIASCMMLCCVTLREAVL